MEQELINKWYENKNALQDKLQEEVDSWETPGWYACMEDYNEFANIVINTILPLDSKRYTPSLHYRDGYVIDIDNDYSGRLSFIFMRDRKLYMSEIDYGSRSGCDSLEHASWSRDPVPELMLLALNLIQETKLIGSWDLWSDFEINKQY